MPYNNPGPSEDMYSDTPTGGETSAPTKEPEEEGSDQVTAVLPKSILAGKKFNVGDEVVLKITAIHEDEIQVEYATEKPSETESESPSEPSEMGSMMD